MEEIMNKNIVKIININDYVKIDRLGHGGYGEVYKVQNKKNKKFYAAKLITKIGNSERIIREVTIPESLEHPCIMKMRGFSSVDFDNDPYPVIVTEYIPKGSLFEMLKKQRNNTAPSKFDATTKYINMYGIAKGMEYLHQNNIIHRDLKTLNILLNDYYYPIICDFGLSKIVDPNECDLQSTKSGTCPYQAPEIFKEDCRYNEKVDVYAYGIILYEIVTGLIPFSQYKTPYEIIKQHKLRNDFRPIFPDTGVNEEIKSLIQECWHHDPKCRPSFSTIIEKLNNEDFARKMNVDWERFLQYDRFISDSRKCYDPNAVSTFIPLERVASYQMEKSLKIYPRLALNDLNEKCQEMVKEAENGNAESMYNVGRCLIRGESGFPRNAELGMQYLNKSIDNDNIKARTFKGYIYYEGLHVPRNVKKAIELLSHSSLRNDSHSLLTLTKIELESRSPDYDKILNNLKILSKRGIKEAMIIHAKLHMKNKGMMSNFQESLKTSCTLFEKANKYDDSEAKAYLALFYYYGFGVIDFDFKKAAELSRLSYEQKNMTGAALFAECLSKGRGIEKNEELAIKIAKESSEHNNSKGKNKYGEFLNIGLNGIQIDKKKAMKLFKESMEQGDEEGKFLYASCLLEGSEYGLDKEPTKAVQLLKESIEEGCISAMVTYGQLQIQGCYVKQDFHAGLKLIEDAANLGNDYAIVLYSYFLIKGFGTSPDYLKATNYLIKGMKRKNSDCYRLYGDLLNSGLILPKKIGKEGVHYANKADSIEWNSIEISQIHEENQKKLDEIEKNNLDEQRDDDIDSDFNNGCLIM